MPTTRPNVRLRLLWQFSALPRERLPGNVLTHWGVVLEIAVITSVVSTTYNLVAAR